MPAIRIEDLPAHVRALIEPVLALPQEDWPGPEKVLQAQVERWLEARGYARRSPRVLRSGITPEKGWQIHLPRATGNPILLDILLLGNDGRYLEFELKSAGKMPSELQCAVLNACPGPGLHIARSLGAVQAMVRKWEAIEWRGR